MGASNVLHGLPDRPLVICLITEPIKMAGVIRAIDLLLGKDGDSIRKRF
jgi:hypothetical protein